MSPRHCLERLRPADGPPLRRGPATCARSATPLASDRADRSSPRAPGRRIRARRCCSAGATTDADVEIYGVPRDHARGLGRRGCSRGASTPSADRFGVLKVHLAPGIDLDVAASAQRFENGAGHRGFAVQGDPFLDFAEASRRRDFTVNASRCDSVDRRDPGRSRAVSTISRAGTLRAVDPRTFPEDPLRVWRAFQFAARLDFGLEPGDASRSSTDDGRPRESSRSCPRSASPTRSEKLLAARPAVGRSGLGGARPERSRASFPELEALAATPQDPEWHPEGDVWVHT